jgi:hypothetical protein
MKLLNALCGVLGWRKEAVMPVESCIPIIPSANLEKSLRLWVDGLGFSMSSEMRKDDKLIFCMLRKENLCFMLNQRAGTPVKPEDYEGIRLYWAPKDIHKTRERLKSLGYSVSDLEHRDYADGVFPYRRRRLCAASASLHRDRYLHLQATESNCESKKLSTDPFGGNSLPAVECSRLLMNTGSAANDSGTLPCVVSNGREQERVSERCGRDGDLKMLPI